MSDSSAKRQKYLELLHLIVTTEKIFIKIEYSCMENLTLQSYQIFFALDDADRKMLLICILELFKRKHYLAFLSVTPLFIEMLCKTVVKNYWIQVISLITYWLRTLQQRQLQTTSLSFAILNYVARVPLLKESKVSSSHERFIFLCSLT